MMRATRRGVIGGAIGGAVAGVLVLPSVPALARASSAGLPAMLHDPGLVAGRRFAAAAAALGASICSVEGDRIYFTREVLRGCPALIAGISRHADALLIEDVAREAGMVLAMSVDARGGLCQHTYARPGWNALVGLTSKAGVDWPEALASYAAQLGGILTASASGPISAPVFGHAFSAEQPDSGLVVGWVLVPRG